MKLEFDIFLLIRNVNSYGYNTNDILASFSNPEEAQRIADEFNNQIEDNDMNHCEYYYVSRIPELDIYKDYVARTSASLKAYIRDGKISYDKIDRDYRPELMTRKESREKKFNILEEYIDLEKGLARVEIQTLEPSKIRKKLERIMEKLNNKIKMAKEMLR